MEQQFLLKETTQMLWQEHTWTVGFLVNLNSRKPTRDTSDYTNLDWHCWGQLGSCSTVGTVSWLAEHKHSKQYYLLQRQSSTHTTLTTRTDKRTCSLTTDETYPSQSLIQPKQKVCEHGSVCAKTINSRQIQHSNSSFNSARHFLDLSAEKKVSQSQH